MMSYSGAEPLYSLLLRSNINLSYTSYLYCWYSHTSSLLYSTSLGLCFFLFVFLFFFCFFLFFFVHFFFSCSLFLARNLLPTWQLKCRLNCAYTVLCFDVKINFSLLWLSRILYIELYSTVIFFDITLALT